MTWATDRAAAAVARTLTEAGETGTLRRTTQVYDPITRGIGAGSTDTPVTVVPAEWTTMLDEAGAKMRVRRIVLSPPGFAVEPGMILLDGAATQFTILKADPVRVRGAEVAILLLCAGGAP